jgi:RND superfamily putative drug exporter
VVALALGSGGKTVDDFSVLGTRSQAAADLLKEKFPAFSGGQTQVVFATRGPYRVTHQPIRQAIEQSVQNLSKSAQVGRVADPFQANAVAPNGHAALAQVQFMVGAAQVEDASLDAMEEAVTLHEFPDFSGALPRVRDRTVLVAQVVHILGERRPRQGWTQI